MIFPVVEHADVPALAEKTIKRSFIFDYESNAFVLVDGALVETRPIEAVQQWFELLVRTALDRYDIYRDTGFGTTLANYIGYRSLPFGFVESELEREISEAALELNPAVADIRDFTVVREARGLLVSLTVVLHDGNLTEVVVGGVL